MKIKPVDTRPRIKVTQGVADPGGRMLEQKIARAVYEGASQAPRMGRKGLVGVGGPNADITANLSALRKRSRHAVRNQPYATTAVETYVSNLVGNGITAKWPDAEMQALWERWIQQCDADGLDNFYGLQMLAARSQFEAGEVLGRKRLRRVGDGLKVPLQIQLMEADHLDEGYNVQHQHNPVVLGVQFNAIGDRQAYHLWRSHPADQPMGATFNQRKPVPASEIIHLFRRLRPGQVRGVPELAPILIRLYEIDEMQDATLVKQKTAQLFGWIIKKENTAAGFTEGTAVTDTAPQMGEAVEGPDGEQLTKITPGGIHYLDSDETAEFSTPDGIGANYVEWLKTELRASAKAAGLTYEQLTGDLTGVNYSSIRAGLVEFRRRMEQLQLHLLIHRFCHPIAEWFADVVMTLGLVDLPGYWRDPFAHLPKWKPPKWEWVDPLKDAMADVLEVRAGLNTRKNKNAERSLDFEEVNDQLLIEQALEIVLDSDPSKVTKTGQYQDLARHLLPAES